MYDVLDVCKYVIEYSNNKDYGISNLKLQKILYFIQSFFVSFTESHEPCFKEKIEAWDFGPVVPEAYHTFKQFGSCDIPTRSSYLMINNSNIWDSQRISYDTSCIEKEDQYIINSIVDKFKDYTATDLVTLTHDQDPWRNAYAKRQNNEITTDSLRRYFDAK